MLHLIENPIIAVARKDEDFEKTLKSPSSIIFLLSANLVTVKERVERAHEVGKKLVVHMDMVLGIGKERINVKATTEEKMGFTGRGEGISAHAVCILKE